MGMSITNKSNHVEVNSGGKRIAIKKDLYEPVISSNVISIRPYMHGSKERDLIIRKVTDIDYPIIDETTGDVITQPASMDDLFDAISSFFFKPATEVWVGGQVTEYFDHKSIVYNPDDSIDYISFKVGGISGTEVARLTFTYDVGGNITEIAKT